MFDPDFIIQEIARNRGVFAGLLENVPPALYEWVPDAKQWSMLEVVCHLHDIEDFDFRQRVRLVLEDPNKPLPTFDPTAWPVERNYLGQNYEEKVDAFLTERDISIQWLKQLQHPSWQNTYQHSTFGPMSAALFLTNWLAHDQLHIRQINRIKRQYLQEQTQMDLRYAGNW